VRIADLVTPVLEEVMDIRFDAAMLRGDAKLRSTPFVILVKIRRPLPIGTR
jgi:hypothetical protein